MKTPASMTAKQINDELDALSKKRDACGHKFIEAGRGSETAAETAAKSDPLAVEWNAIADRQVALHSEIETRYGPGAPYRLPTRGFGPRKAVA